MLKKIYFCACKLLRGVIGNTSDSGSEESRFEPWRSNKINRESGFFVAETGALTSETN